MASLVNWYRILWLDAAGEGRWTDVQASGPAAAAWKAAQETESKAAQFEGIQESPKQGSQVRVES